MRVSAAYLTVLCAILCQQARADDPPAPSQPAAPTTTVPTSAQPSATPAAEKGAATDAEQKAAPAAASPVIKPGVTVVGTKPDLTPDEKELIKGGYKLEMRHGEKYFCRWEQQMGTRFETKYCDTAQSIQAHRVESQEAVRTIQNDRPLINH